MRKIKLTKGYYTVVDDEDFERFGKHNWCISSNGYAKRNIHRFESTGKQHTVLLHRLIVNAPRQKQVDHINGNKLDNRKQNLRPCSMRENQWNVGLSKTNKSGFKGVSKSKNRWIATMRVNNEYMYLGSFKEKVAAARAYNEAAIKYQGEYAKLNNV